jgi:hypothetical protein
MKAIVNSLLGKISLLILSIGVVLQTRASTTATCRYNPYRQIVGGSSIDVDSILLAMND